MRPFWITSMGRTATKWLASVLQVPHEPKEDPVPFRAVSPMHLDWWVSQGWSPGRDSKFGVIVRDAREQLLSVFNRFHAVHPNPRRHLNWWVVRVPIYLETLAQLIDKHGAAVIDYDRMTSDKGYLEQLAIEFDCEIDWSAFDSRPNTFKKVKLELTPAQRALAGIIQEFYDECLNRHAT